MVVTASAAKRPHPGARPINLNTDIPQILKLLEICFGTQVGFEGQHFYTGSGGAMQQPAFLWRLNPAAQKLSLGFVWEENGRIVGNVTVLTTQIPGRYLVVNVAVHPDQRRRGIARQLMHNVHQMVHDRNGSEIMLQVVKSNEAAVNLYKTLQYTSLGSMTSWYAPISRLRQPLPAQDNNQEPSIRELRRQEWREAYHLDLSVLPPDLHWPEPPEPNMYKSGFWRKTVDFFNGRSMENWVATQNKQLTGLATILSEWGRTHVAGIRVHPEWQGQLERPLLAKLIRRLYYLPRRNVRIDHPDNDTYTGELLREANFQPKRTLTHMRLKL